MRQLHRLLLVAVLSLALDGCAAALLNNASRPAPSSDGTITASIEQRLALEPGLGAVRVTTRQGIVTLDGQVTAEAERRRAEELARATGGVRAVRNQLAVAGYR